MKKGSIQTGIPRSQAFSRDILRFFFVGFNDFVACDERKNKKHEFEDFND